MAVRPGRLDIFIGETSVEGRRFLVCPVLSPDWLVGLVADVEAPPLELNDVSLFQVFQARISKHFLLALKG